MKIVVCAKQVPNTNEVKIDPVKGTLIRDGVESILNPRPGDVWGALVRWKTAEHMYAAPFHYHGKGNSASALLNMGHRREKDGTQRII